MNHIVAFFVVMLGFIPNASADWNFGISVGYSPNYMVNQTGTGTSSGVFSAVKYDLNYDSTVEFGVDIWNTPKHSWGFISGFQYSGERKLKSGTINGSVVSATSDTSKYQTHFVYAGTAYRWESFYIPLAVTYGITKFTPATPVNNEFKSGPGVLLGIGWIIADRFVIEYLGRSAMTELNVTSGSDYMKTTGTVSSAVLNLKYLF